MIKAKLSDLKIGNEIVIQITGAKEYHKIRSKLTEFEMKKLKVWQPKEETEQEYQEYKSVIKYYVKMGCAYIE